MVYGMLVGTLEGLIKLWGDHTYDYALAYGFSVGVSLVLGMLIGIQTFYWVNVALLRYIRSIRSYVNGTMELVGLDPADQTSTSKVPFLFHAVTWFQMMFTVCGAITLWVSTCNLIIRLLVGFPDWIASLLALLIGLVILALGVSVGFFQCYRLDRQAKYLRRTVVARLSEKAVLEPVSDGTAVSEKVVIEPGPDGTAVVTTMQTGEKWVVRLTGFRSGLVLNTT
jgi:hypothetical protein